VERKFADRYIVWTRPQAAFLFRGIPSCEVICSQFPVGTRKQFGGAEVIRFLRAAWRIRRQRPEISIDLIGDFRERMFARLAGSHRHVHIGWDRDHPFSRIVRNPLGPGTPLVTIQAGALNVYAAYGSMLDALAPGDRILAGPGSAPADLHFGTPLRVGVHPFASQKSKLWPDENWRRLVRELIRQGARVRAFGSPSERHALIRILGDQAGHVDIVTEDIESFARHIATLDVLIGLDSFAVHLAWRQGVYSVTINGANPPGFWSVPSRGAVLASSGGCSYYPCFNVPRCEGSSGEYACVRSISVEEVLRSVTALSGTRAAERG
jgi:heptosyltransferase-3